MFGHLNSKLVESSSFSISIPIDLFPALPSAPSRYIASSASSHVKIVLLCHQQNNAVMWKHKNMTRISIGTVENLINAYNPRAR